MKGGSGSPSPETDGIAGAAAAATSRTATQTRFRHCHHRSAGGTCPEWAPAGVDAVARGDGDGREQAVGAGAELANGGRAQGRAPWSRRCGSRALGASARSRRSPSPGRTSEFGRPKTEIEYLMGMFERMIRDNVDEYMREGIRVHVIGDSSKGPVSLQNVAREAEEMAMNNSRLHLMIALCCSGRWEIGQACREVARKVQGNLLRPEDIDESLLAGNLETSVAAGELSCPDLLIRTSGELRLSNFLLWQAAYIELFFTNTMWPDFGEAEYLQALSSFQSRERRFGQRKFHGE